LLNLTATTNDRQLVIFDGDLQTFLRHTRKIRFDTVVIVCLEDVHGRHKNFAFTFALNLLRPNRLLFMICYCVHILKFLFPVPACLSSLETDRKASGHQMSMSDCVMPCL